MYFEDKIRSLTPHHEKMTVLQRSLSYTLSHSASTFKVSALAERVGFEPTILPLTGYRFSRAGPSATRQPLQYNFCYPVCIQNFSLITLLSGSVNTRGLLN